MKMISYLEHESETTRLERINKRLLIALVVSVAFAAVSCTFAILGGI